MSNRNGNQGQRNASREMGANELLTIKQKIVAVLEQVSKQRPMIEGVLPRHMSFDDFAGNIRLLLLMKPEIFVCTGPSIINACVKSAYDGLRLDGIEAVLTAHDVKVGSNPNRYEKQAVYFPMVQGITKQILLSPAVESIRVEVIRQHDDYEVDLAAKMPLVRHRLNLLVEDRGPIIAAYSLVHLSNGGVSFELMTKKEINEVRAVAKTQGVWDKWEGEQSKKSVLRRHRKRLPRGVDFAFYDIEARSEFPQFDQAVHPQLTDMAEKPTRPRPQRGSALPNDQRMPAQDMHLDPMPETIDGRAEQADEPGQAKQRPSHQTETASSSASEPAASQPWRPKDEAEWNSWAEALEASLTRYSDIDGVNDLWDEKRDLIDAAPTVIRDGVNESFRDRIAHLAAGADDAAGASGAQN